VIGGLMAIEGFFWYFNGGRQAGVEGLAR